jgi:hypothetical protein
MSAGKGISWKMITSKIKTFSISGGDGFTPTAQSQNRFAFPSYSLARLGFLAASFLADLDDGGGVPSIFRKPSSKLNP